MRAELSFLSQDEIEHIHEASLHILSTTGVRIYSEKVRSLLAQYGAKVDDTIVRFPNSVMEEALNQTPHEILLAARESKRDIRIPTSTFPFLATSGFSPFVTINLDTGERRSATTQDLKHFAILSDYLDTVDYFWPIVIPNDLPPPLQELHALAIALENNTKHIQCSCVTEKTAQWQIRLASVIAGDETKLQERPLFSTINCPVAPLTFEKDCSEAMVTLAKAGIPVAPMTMVLASTTAPATLAGTLALANAEELAALIILQSANPSAPMIYTSEAATANMKTGEIDYHAPEYPLISAGCGQMARFYKLPSLVADMSSGTVPNDMASFTACVLRIAMGLMSRTDLSACLGSRDSALSASLEQVVIDAEACEHASAYLRRFEINDATLALDVIDRVGPGGNFLSQKHTIEHFRREIWSRELCNTFILDPTVKGSFLEKARAKVKEILATHAAPPLKEDVHKEMEQILRDAEKDILGNS